MNAQQIAMLQCLVGAREELGEWQQGFVDGLAARDNAQPLREWQAAQLRVVYLETFTGDAEAS